MKELSMEDRAIVCASLHIAKHFWSADTEDAADRKIVELIEDFKPSKEEMALNPKEQVTQNQAIGEFIQSALNCEFLERVFMAGILAVGITDGSVSPTDILKDFDLDHVQIVVVDDEKEVKH